MVYGGIGRAARNWESFDRIVATLQRLEDDETLLVQSGKPVGVFRTHADAPRVLHRQFQPRAALGDLGAFQRARSQGADDVRPDDGRLVDLHRHARASCRAPTRPSSRWAASIIGGDLAGQLDPDRRARRHGRRAAAGRHHGRRVDASPIECQPSRIEMRLRTALSRRRRPTTLDEALAIIDAGQARQASAISVGLLGNAADILPELVRRGVRPDSSPTRPRARSDQRLSAEGLDARPNGEQRASDDPKAVAKRGQALDGRACARDARLPRRWASRRVDYGNNIRQMAQGRRRARTRSTSRASCRPISARCSAAASGRSAGPRCRAIRKTSTRPTPR